MGPTWNDNFLSLVLNLLSKNIISKGKGREDNMKMQSINDGKINIYITSAERDF